MNRFVGGSGEVVIPQCYKCKHLTDVGKRRCIAFGDKRIPDRIWLNQFDHRNPFPGDNGIQFEPKKETANA